MDASVISAVRSVASIRSSSGRSRSANSGQNGEVRYCSRRTPSIRRRVRAGSARRASRISVIRPSGSRVGRDSHRVAPLFNEPRRARSW